MHPVTRTVSSARAGLREVAERPVWSMDAATTGAALVEVTRLAAQVAQLQMRLLAYGERLGVGDEAGATSTATWLAHQTRTTRPVLHRAARLAERLETAHPDTDQALAAGEITLEQAQVIVEAVDALPTDLVTTQTIAEAETFLLDHARHHDARGLRVLGRRLLEVLDPEAADAEEARRLRKEEAAARAAASFTMSEDGHHAARAARLDPPQAPPRPRRAGPPPRPPRHHPHQAQAGAGLRRVPRDPPRVDRPPRRWPRRHRRGHHDPRVTPRRPAGRRAL